MEKSDNCTALTPHEEELLDHLYFITSFKDLLRETGWDNEALIMVLNGLYQRGLIRLFYPDIETEMATGLTNIAHLLPASFAFASKEGLKLHNER